MSGGLVPVGGYRARQNSAVGPAMSNPDSSGAMIDKMCKRFYQKTAFCSSQFSPKLPNWVTVYCYGSGQQCSHVQVCLTYYITFHSLYYIFYSLTLIDECVYVLFYTECFLFWVIRYDDLMLVIKLLINMPPISSYCYTLTDIRSGHRGRTGL